MSLINDALKKAQQKRAEESAAQPPAKDSVAPAPGTPGSTAANISRPELPAQPQGPRRSPSPSPAKYQPPAETPTKPRVSAIRYNPSGDDDKNEDQRSRMPGTQKTFWVTLGIIAAIAVVVRITATLSRSSDEPTANSKPAERAPATPTEAAPQVSVPLPLPTLAIQTTTPAAPAVKTEPATATPVEPAPETAPAPVVAFQPAAAPTVGAAKPDTPAPAASTTTPAVSFTSKPEPAAIPKIVAAPPAPAETPVAKVPALVVAKTEPEPPPAATIATTPPKPAPTVLPPIYAPRAPTPVNNSTRIQNFIDRLRVSGVRITSTGSKVILNDRLFSVGETIDSNLELKLVKVEEGVLTFADTTGKKYVKLFQ